ncbi:MAG: CarD family transcriptional regulator [Clostridiales bacterium]|mgnify:CR=1 FL=1|jgi:CarD family transcriptional regulator|nr:CarD family transcriptional regulator [Clostridiales bacterium]
MYNINDLIVYGSTGVCRIKDIKNSDLMGSGEKQLCYVLEPIYHDYVISTPVENTKVFMRPILTKDEAEQLIDSIPSINAEAYHNSVLRQLEAHYKSFLDTHDCMEILKLILSLYEKKKEVEEQNRKFGQIDERFLRQAEDLLFGELSASLDIPRDTIVEYVKSRLEDRELLGDDAD